MAFFVTMYEGSMKTILLLLLSASVSLAAFAQKDKYLSEGGNSSKAAGNKNSLTDGVSKTLYCGTFGLDYTGSGIKAEGCLLTGWAFLHPGPIRNNGFRQAIKATNATGSPVALSPGFKLGMI